MYGVTTYQNDNHYDNQKERGGSASVPPTKPHAQ